ncbi:MAG: DMT family transporter [Lachnospiraceae bacterium]|nr:DMT family transporter [Lachnospiraceae bacterium]
MENNRIRGHLAALLTIGIWGTTFISTKILLKDFLPVEILFFRFILGYIALWCVFPHNPGLNSKKQELTFMAAGLCGICLYYLLENVSLNFTLASNVGVIISIAPFFTAILSHIFIKSDEKPEISFFAGFILAMIGIGFISFGGSSLTLNLKGDLLAMAAAFVWACYSILTRKISTFAMPTVYTTRRTFFYGILFMIPALFLFDFHPDLKRLANPLYAFNIIFLGLGASALCFVTWNYAVKILGAVKTSVYIYMVPVITVVTSILVLQEKITLFSIIGMIFTVAGLFLSEMKYHEKQG